MLRSLRWSLGTAVVVVVLGASITTSSAIYRSPLKSFLYTKPTPNPPAVMPRGAPVGAMPPVYRPGISPTKNHPLAPHYQFEETPEGKLIPFREK